MAKVRVHFERPESMVGKHTVTYHGGTVVEEWEEFDD